MEKLIHIIESAVFASGSGIKKELLLEHLPEVTDEEIDKAIQELKKHYNGDRGIKLVTASGKYIFQTNPDYGEIISEILTKEKERELSRTLLEVMAIIAYKQPITRIEIEDIRGVNSEYAVSMLLKLNLIDSVGRKETIGRPILYGTTEEFLLRFGLASLNDLPDYDMLYEQIKQNFSPLLFPEKDIADDPTATVESDIDFTRADDTENDGQEEESDEDISDTISEEEYPDFLDDDEFDVISDGNDEE